VGHKTLKLECASFFAAPPIVVVLFNEEVLFIGPSLLFVAVFFGVGALILFPPKCFVVSFRDWVCRVRLVCPTILYAVP